MAARLIYASLLLAGASSLPVIVQAQEQAATAQPSVLEEIVVTAQRRSEALQDAPVAVTAFTSEALERRGLSSVADLATATPSLTVRTGTTDNITPLVSLRAQSQTRSDLGKQPSVGLYFDGVYGGALSLSGVSSGLVDVERVEVLRGPQGTLYGRNTPGGAMNIITKLPSDNFEGLAQVTVGSNDLRSFAGVINVPFNEHAALRVVAQTQRDSGYARKTWPADFLLVGLFVLSPESKKPIDTLASHLSN